jgi:hypothetical protein
MIEVFRGINAPFFIKLRSPAEININLDNRVIL